MQTCGRGEVSREVSGGPGPAAPSPAGGCIPAAPSPAGGCIPAAPSPAGGCIPAAPATAGQGDAASAATRGERAPAPHKFLSAETLNSRSPGSRELFKLPTISSSKSFGEPANPYATRVPGNTAAPGKLPATRLENRTAHRDYLPHTSSAISRTRATLAHCCSSVSLLPTSQLAKPHCGDR